MPLPAEARFEKFPEPPTALEVNAMSASTGSPEGFRFPKESRVMRVTVMLPPELRFGFDTVTELSLTE